MREPICLECAVAEADRVLEQSAKTAGVDLSLLSSEQRSLGFMLALSLVMKHRRIVGESCSDASDAARIRSRISAAQLN
jgi:hypothetical protein